MLLSLRTDRAIFLLNANSVQDAIDKYKNSEFYIGEIEYVKELKTTSDLYDNKNYYLEIKLL